MLCIWFDVTGIGGAPRGPYWFCLSKQKEFPCASKCEKGSLAWQSRVLWGLPASFGGHPSGQLSSAQLLPECLSGRKILWLSEEEKHFLRQSLLWQMSPARGGWEDFLVWVPAAGSSLLVPPSHPMSLAVGGESQARRRRALLLKAYCQWGLYWSREEEICLHCLLLPDSVKRCWAWIAFFLWVGGSKIPCT